MVYICFFFLISVGNTDAFFNQTSTHLDKLCEVDEPVQEEPDKSNYFLQSLLLETF